MGPGGGGHGPEPSLRATCTPETTLNAWKAPRTPFFPFVKSWRPAQGAANVGNSWSGDTATLGSMADVVESGLASGCGAHSPPSCPGIWARPQLCDPGMPQHALSHGSSCPSFYGRDMGTQRIFYLDAFLIQSSQPPWKKRGLIPFHTPESRASSGEENS